MQLITLQSNRDSVRRVKQEQHASLKDVKPLNLMVRFFSINSSISFLCLGHLLHFRQPRSQGLFPGLGNDELHNRDASIG